MLFLICGKKKERRSGWFSYDCLRMLSVTDNEENKSRDVIMVSGSDFLTLKIMNC